MEPDLETLLMQLSGMGAKWQLSDSGDYGPGADRRFHLYVVYRNDDARSCWGRQIHVVIQEAIDGAPQEGK